jgi:hypothetical protein
MIITDVQTELKVSTLWLPGRNSMFYACTYVLDGLSRASDKTSRQSCLSPCHPCTLDPASPSLPSWFTLQKTSELVSHVLPDRPLSTLALGLGLCAR